MVSLIASYIVLPPLHQISLTAASDVTVFHAGQTLTSTLSTALAQFPQAALALHPADAPMHAVNLPPLPANRRDAALRVKLDDLLLSDTAQLTLAVTTLAKNSFAVSCVATPLLISVLASLQALGHANRPVIALASSLPADSERSLGAWTLWRDAQSAGALPSVEGHTAPPLSAADLSGKAANTAIFTATQAKGSTWQRWRWAALLAVLCGLTYTAGLWLHSRSLLALEAQANRSMAAAFQEALPNTPMVYPVVQLQRAATGGNALTTALGSIPADWPQGMVTQLNWSSKRLSITASPAPLKLNEAQQKTFTDALAAKNIAVTWSKQ
jgi:type II secretory pathway component PulL